ncbi:PREDICTED: pentatricopeptide repeat-containing protein At4g39952, mitochondrial [Camelina sativa]|uniref:Pentatricopeptide repeat-containing protein At4g39952, mitochondrial n=1 Tax=Camelina sativa TaxID=90675 RepID=A0ABM1QQF6_CAMSA|nr:PREDICTED: pentatricopeptide repeat-containing protein At4g39952, mitochondrial [Camelina sativa]
MVVSASAELLWFDVGSFLHGLFLKLGFFHLVGASFVYFYSKCGFLDDACNVFDEMPERDVVAWTAIISGHVQNGESERGLGYLCKMLSLGSDDDHEKPNPRTLECGFQACVNLGALKEGRCLHGFTVKNGLASSSKTVQSSIFSFYSKSGGGVPAEAYLSFRELGGDDEDIFSWTSVIASLARSGNIKESFDMFWEMQNKGVHPDGVVVSCLINELGKMMVVAQGKAFHGFVIRRCFSLDGTVCNSLLSMYCKFELLSAAEKVFCRIPEGGGNKEAWNTMLKGYGKMKCYVKCIESFKQIQNLGIEIDSASAASVISTCSHIGAVLLGKSLHCYAVKTSLDLTISVVNSLIDLYGKMGDLTVAWRMFCEADTDIVTWNAMIACYVHCEQPDKAIALFDRMISENFKPSSVTLVTLLMACANTGSLERGQVIHRYITETEHEMNLSLSTALIDMYAKCGHLEKSRELFDAANQKDAVCWNVMISGYGMHGQVESAIELFEQMEESDVKPTGPTFLALLSAFTHAGLVEKGRNLLLKMHQYDVKPNLKHYSCLVDLLSRSGNLQEAETTVMSMPFSPDGVIWGTLLSSCMTYGEFEMGIRMAERAVASDPQNDGYYIMLANMYSAAGKWEQAERAREMMRESGVGKRAGHSVV